MHEVAKVPFALVNFDRALALDPDLEVAATTIVSQLYKAVHLNPVTYLKEE
jgi:hypothetical protein